MGKNKKKRVKPCPMHLDVWEWGEGGYTIIAFVARLKRFNHESRLAQSSIAQIVPVKWSL